MSNLPHMGFLVLLPKIYTFFWVRALFGAIEKAECELPFSQSQNQTNIIACNDTDLGRVLLSVSGWVREH